MHPLTRRSFLAVAGALLPAELLRPHAAGAATSDGPAWSPPAVVLALAAAHAGHYDGAPPWGSPCAHALTPLAQQLEDEVRKVRPSIPIGGLACRPNTADTAQLSVHGVGRALDLMTTDGDDLANWLLVNSAALEVQLVIWRHRIWKVGGSFRPYRGPNPHTNHIHVEVHATAGDASPMLRGLRAITPRPDPLAPVHLVGNEEL